MRFCISKFKVIVLMMALLMLLQSCSVYHKETVSLEAAVTSKKEVLIVKKDKTKEKYSRIEKIDGKYIGVNYREKKQSMIIEEQNIDTVRLKNNGLTNLASISIVLGSIVAFVSVITVAAFSVMADPA